MTPARTARSPVTGVRTSAGDIECETSSTAPACGPASSGERHGVVIPNQAAEHYYLITDTIPGLDPDGADLRGPGALRLLPRGGRRHDGRASSSRRPPRGTSTAYPSDFSFGTLPPDWDRMAPALETAMSRVPVTIDVGVRTFFCGPESFTPDRRPRSARRPASAGYFVAAGLNSVGILSSGGLGRVWRTGSRAGGRTSTSPPSTSRASCRTSSTATTGATASPRSSARRTPPTHRASRAPHRSRHLRLAGPRRDGRRGRKLKDVSGWESADWYAGDGRDPARSPRRGAGSRGSTSGRPSTGAVREAVGLIDMSFMATFAVTGRDAGAVLERVSAGHVDGDVDRITYTQWLGPDGGIEADLTVTKRGEGDFLVVASDTAHGHTLAWLRRQIGDAEVVDRGRHRGDGTAQRPGSALARAAGRRSPTPTCRTRLPVPDRPQRSRSAGRRAALRAHHLRRRARLRALRPPRARGHGLEGAARGGHGIRARAGGAAGAGSLRLEKAYRDYGHDIDNTDTVGGGARVRRRPRHRVHRA